MSDIGDMTTGEAEAWRAGWRAAQEAALRIAGDADASIEECRCTYAGIRAMQPPAKITNPPGRALEGA